jgi:hypothetical protein
LPTGKDTVKGANPFARANPFGAGIKPAPFSAKEIKTMSDLNAFAELLGIPPDAVSKRLAFVKKSLSDARWHIGDHNFLTESPVGLLILTLHQKEIPKQIVADSLKAAFKMSAGRFELCAECADEFRFNLAAIQAERTTRFVAFDKVLTESRSDKPIGGEIPISPREPRKGN